MKPQRKTKAAAVFCKIFNSSGLTSFGLLTRRSCILKYIMLYVPTCWYSFHKELCQNSICFYWIYFDDVWWINFTAFNEVFLHVSKTAWVKIYMYMVIFLCNAYSQYLKNSNSWNYLMIYNHGASNVYSLWNYFCVTCT